MTVENGKINLNTKALGAGSAGGKLFCHRRNPQRDDAAGNFGVQRNADADRFALGVHIFVNDFLPPLERAALRVNRHAHRAVAVGDFQRVWAGGFDLPHVTSAVSNFSGAENFTSSRTSSDGVSPR